MNNEERVILDDVLWAERVIKKYISLYNNIITFNSSFGDITFKQKIYNYYNGIKVPPNCKMCENLVNFHNKKYNTYCSNKCTSNDVDVNNKRRKTFEETMLKKYGVKSPFKIPGIKENILKKNIKKWGVDIPSKSKYIKDKISKTKLSKSDEENTIINDKRSKTNLEKWGVENVAKSEYIKELTVLSNLKKWGVEYPIQLQNIVDKRRNNYYEKHGVEHHFQVESILNKMQLKRKETIHNNYLDSISHLNLNIINYKDKEIEIICEKCASNYTIPIYLLYQRCKNNMTLCTHCNPLDVKSSSHEKEIIEFFEENNISNIIINDRKILEGKELDIYLPDYDLAIELNGTYWHSEIYKDVLYHLSKTEKCQESGINLIHIFQDDWLYKSHIIKSIIRNKLGLIDTKIFARKCEIKEVSSKDSREFLDNNHIQGFAKSKYKIGLYYNNELVSLMTFGYRMTNSKKEFELIRFCNKINTNIIGSASKLFKYFIRNNNYESIISYADVSMFDGNLYKILGFNYVHRSKPNYYWVVDGIRRHRFNYNKKKLIKEGFDENMTEVEIMHERGYYRIWGCGQDKYIFNS